MPAIATTPTSVLLTLGESWTLAVDAVDVAGAPVGAAPALVVTRPDGTTVSPIGEVVATGSYRWTYTPIAAGRYVATVSTVDDVATFAAYAAGVTTGAGMPTPDDIAVYLGAAAASWPDTEISDALDAEAAAQRHVCRVRAVYPADLREALFRRVMRNLALRRLPLAVLTGDAEAGPMVLPGRDQEVRRLEAPHRRMPIG